MTPLGIVGGSHCTVAVREEDPEIVGAARPVGVSGRVAAAAMALGRDVPKSLVACTA